MIQSYLTHCIRCALRGIRPNDPETFYRLERDVLLGMLP